MTMPVHEVGGLGLSHVQGSRGEEQGGNDHGEGIMMRENFCLSNTT